MLVLWENPFGHLFWNHFEPYFHFPSGTASVRSFVVFDTLGRVPERNIVASRRRHIWMLEPGGCGWYGQRVSVNLFLSPVQASRVMQVPLAVHISANEWTPIHSLTLLKMSWVLGFVSEAPMISIIVISSSLRRLGM